MKVNIVSARDMAKGAKNPTFCISALRYTYNCHKCRMFQYIYEHKSKNIIKILKILKCKPFLSTRIIKRIEVREKIIKDFNKIKEQLENEFPLN